MSGSISSAGAVPCNKAEQCVLSSAPWEVEITAMGEEASVAKATRAVKSPVSLQHPKDLTNVNMPVYTARSHNDLSALQKN